MRQDADHHPATSQVRDRIASVLRAVRDTAEPVCITRYGRAEAVILSIERYAVMMDLLEDREDEQDSALGRSIAEQRAAYARGEGRALEELLRELASAEVSGDASGDASG